MASTGKVKWKKYFEGKTTHTKIKGTKGKPVTVYSSVKSGKKVDSLADGYDIAVLEVAKFEPRYYIAYKKGSSRKVGYVSQNNVAKPIQKKGATENLGVRAETLILGGKLTKEDYAGVPVRVRKFKTHQQLAKSILEGLKRNKKVSEGIIEVFEKFLAKNSRYEKIEWTSEVHPTEINELGKYVGELIIGLLALRKNTSTFSKKFYEGPIDAFCVPDDPSFVGVDSFLLMKDGEVVPISSKYGVGAKASFFANLLPKAIEYSDDMKKCVLKDIVKSAEKAGVTVGKLEKKQGSKEVLYQHGINSVLKLKIKNPYQVFLDIKKEKSNPEVDAVLSAILRHPEAEAKVKNLLPDSTTAFFSREIARQLNADKKSKQYMLEILSGKNFWQANLNIAKWKKGEISYKIINSGESKVTIIGSKSAMGDIDARQGMLNYEIKLP